MSHASHLLSPTDICLHGGPLFTNETWSQFRHC
jgi:hypothetical protein